MSIVWDFRIEDEDDDEEAERQAMEQQLREADEAAYMRILGYIPGRKDGSGT